MTGNSGNNLLQGGGGNDIFHSGGGTDTFEGGTGNDTFHVDNAATIVLENAGQGIDTVISSVTFQLSAEVENLTLSGSASINGTGNFADNTLIGNLGNNALVGGGGNDTFFSGGGIDSFAGGTGDDTYVVSNGLNTITELAGQGIDTVLSYVSFQLFAASQQIENLTLAGTGNSNGTGNARDNLITGNAGNNMLTGGGGSDTFVFANNFGTDKVVDFNVAGSEFISLAGVTAITDFADLASNHLSEVGGNAVITDGGNTITLLGVTMASLTTDDFVF